MVDALKWHLQFIPMVNIILPGLSGDIEDGGDSDDCGDFGDFGDLGVFGDLDPLGVLQGFQ